MEWGFHFVGDGRHDLVFVDIRGLAAFKGDFQLFSTVIDPLLQLLLSGGNFQSSCRLDG